MNESGKFIQTLVKFFTCSGDPERGVDLEKIAAQEQKQFSYETLAFATKNFHESHKLGEGGFGPVYKGKLSDGREIAVKKLSKSSRQGRREFMNEARLLARVQHRNVVNLLGYCVYGAEKLLVYEYVAHESLDKLIFKSSKQDELNWRRRYDIILGISRGLLYLHEDAHCVIIHRDIKASNILLDDKWVPKIADFGMARLFPEDQTHVQTRVAGTNGYMAPEYVLNGHLSVKADVFSFGVVVLELISGQKNSTFNQRSAALTLMEWAHELYKNGRSMEFVDPKLASSAVPEQISMSLQIGLLCVQTDPKERPDMRRVVVMLSKKPGSALEEPTKPGYPTFTNRRRQRRQRTGSSSGQATGLSSSSSNGGTSSGSRSHTFGSATSTNSVAVPATPTYLRSPLSDPHGKRPMES